MCAHLAGEHERSEALSDGVLIKRAGVQCRQQYAHHLSFPILPVQRQQYRLSCTHTRSGHGTLSVLQPEGLQKLGIV